MTGGDSLTRLRPWNALAVALLVLYVVGLVLFCYAALTTTPAPTAYAIRRPPFAAYGDPRAWWPVALQLALGAGRLRRLLRPRRHETRSFSLAGHRRAGAQHDRARRRSGCGTAPRRESPFFAPLAIALAPAARQRPDLHRGLRELPFPLAVQVARLFGPLLLVITALGIAAALFRSQLDRLVVRFARSLVVVVGLSEEALPLVRRLATDLPRRTVLAVLVADGEPAGQAHPPDRGPGGGLRPGRHPNALRVLALRQRRFKVQALYLVSADVSANLAWARRFRDIADASAAAPSPTRRRGSPRGSTTRGRRSTGGAPTPTGRRPATGPSRCAGSATP